VNHLDVTNLIRDNWGSITMLCGDSVTFDSNESEQTKCFQIDSAYAGDNYIVAAHPDSATMRLYCFNLSGTKLQCLTGNGWKDLEDHQTKMLTVWRTLWVELDQMEKPVIQATQNDPPSPHGFTFATRAKYDPSDPNKVISGNWDISTNLPAGWSATPKIGKEPDDFDVVYVNGNGEPLDIDLPDISLLTSDISIDPLLTLPPIFQAACIEVEKVSQSEGDPDPLWIVGNDNSWNPGVWNTTTPFQRELEKIGSTDEITDISNHSRDVVMYNNPEFWCIHGIGAYEDVKALTYDPPSKEGVNWCLGKAVQNGKGIFIIFNETIRDKVSTDSSVKRSISDTRQLTALHEILHLFGFADGPADGQIMTTDWLYADSLVSTYITFSDTQIQKIQKRGCPR